MLEPYRSEALSALELFCDFRAKFDSAMIHCDLAGAITIRDCAEKEVALIVCVSV